MTFAVMRLGLWRKSYKIVLREIMACSMKNNDCLGCPSKVECLEFYDMKCELSKCAGKQENIRQYIGR